MAFQELDSPTISLIRVDEIDKAIVWRADELHCFSNPLPLRQDTHLASGLVSNAHNRRASPSPSTHGTGTVRP